MLKTAATDKYISDIAERLDSGDLCDTRGTTGIECSELDAIFRDLGRSDPRFLALSKDLLAGKLNCE